ncbi:tetratricopeptide repeat protein [Nocardia cyriacigeorgica]|uniref:tetratricopeptide repeat protein n=2 Tax=Nocardia cyriacigeorgica TaxID=135487 RepID=UPI001893504B|nr:tetratricopeptide repeat protein [Nocardia cyriacigeorgica]MBF6454181.1 tetratricopeptide repeat protein [Nocardia cyriacigeorgica]MBF6552075.1 tetratricopeptide repeat protein [Nocardia cyriacigeorgica]
MANRVALIVGSQCAALPPRNFFEELATEFHSAVTRRGGWQPVIDTGLVLNPTVTELKTAIKRAFATADASNATLLLFFLGHGTSSGTADFRLLAQDSPARGADSDTAIHLTQTIRERLGEYPSLDGLIVLVDACEAGEAVAGAGSRWPEMLAVDGRFELLVASGDHNAYDGCFTRTLLDMFDAGMPTAGSQLLCADFVDALAQRCPRQIPHHTSHTRGSPIRTNPGDRGLWLVPNQALHRHAVTGHAAAGFVDQLTTAVLITTTVREALQAVLDARPAPLRLVHGPAGAGKSTVLSLLIRPNLVDELDINEKYVTAAVFLDITSTLDSLTADIVDQLHGRVPGYTAAREAAQNELTSAERANLTGFDVDIARALRRCPRRVTVVIDGLDQPEPGARSIIVAAIRQLTTDHPDRPPVHVIAGVRTGTEPDTGDELRHATRIHVAAPTRTDLQDALAARGIRDASATLDHLVEALDAGGWLLGRLLTEIAAEDEGALPGQAGLSELIKVRLEIAERRCADRGVLDTTIRILLAAGIGPSLPIPVLRSALLALGADLPLARIRDLLVELGSLIARGRPGLPEETVGIIHSELASALTGVLGPRGSDDRRIHRAIISALETQLDAPDAVPTAAIAAYARSSLPRHHLAAGDSAAALAALSLADTDRAADNHQRWAAWLPEFEKALGADHRDTLRLRAGIATWLGDSGHVAAAVARFGAVLAAQERVLGRDHPDTLDTRGELAQCSGDAEAAVAQLTALLTDRLRVQGRDHHATVATIRALAWWRGRSGDYTGALGDLDALLDTRLRVLDPLHPEILSLRGLVASLHGKSGQPEQAVRGFTTLLADRTASLGPDHPDTLTTRSDLAYWLARTGDVDSAVGHYRILLEQRQRVLGADHADTLRTRASLAFWHGASGDPQGAVAEYRQQVSQRRRILGPDHPKTLLAQENLAAWLGLVGDTEGAVTEYEALHVRRLRLLGPDHPDTRQAERGLTFWREARQTASPGAAVAGAGWRPGSGPNPVDGDNLHYQQRNERGWLV